MHPGRMPLGFRGFSLDFLEGLYGNTRGEDAFDETETQDEPMFRGGGDCAALAGYVLIDRGVLSNVGKNVHVPDLFKEGKKKITRKTSKFGANLRIGKKLYQGLSAGAVVRAISRKRARPGGALRKSCNIPRDHKKGGGSIPNGRGTYAERGSRRGKKSFCASAKGGHFILGE